MSPPARIPVGSWVLVTGVNGLVASHVANELLSLGYKVRGSARDPKKLSWMHTRFDKQYGQGNFEIVAVEDLTKDGAFDDAVKGMAGVLHIASIVGPVDPNESIPGVIAGALSILRSASKEPSIKSYVYTSSSWAASNPLPNEKYHIGPDTWNTAAVKKAWAPPPYTQERLMDVYAASKMEAEQASWKFMEEEKPGFVMNAVLPSANFGAVLDTEHQGFPSTTAWFKDLFEGNIGVHPYVPPQFAIDTVDCARLHVGALLDTTVESQRLFGYAEPYTWNELLAIFRTMYPDRKFCDDIADQGKDLSTVSSEGAEEVLRRMGGKGFTTLEDSIKSAVEQILVEQMVASKK